MGREAERRALDALVAGARLGRSGVLLLVGEPGIGKTTLLDYVASRAEGMYVVRVAGAEAERDLPFGALALAMGTATADLDELPAPQAAALRTALALDTGPPPDRFAVGAATLGVMTRRAERQPLAILLDDAHHLDRPSAEALVFAARRLVADPILVVAALREGEPSPLRAADLPVLAITGLDQAGTADLLRSADTAPGASDRAAWVHRATGGNPLAIVELARTAAESEIRVGRGERGGTPPRAGGARGGVRAAGEGGRVGGDHAARVGRGGGGGPARGPRRGAGPPPRSRHPAADRVGRRWSGPRPTGSSSRTRWSVRRRTPA